jgi:hypothetical protein
LKVLSFSYKFILFCLMMMMMMMVTLWKLQRSSGLQNPNP